MKYSYSLLAVAAIASLASAQIPACAQPCIDKAVTSATTCAVTDQACACQKDNQAAIQAAATSCVLSSCGATQAVAVLTAAQALCASLPPPAASTSAAAPPPAVTTAAPPAVSSSAAAAPTTSAAAPPASSPAPDCGCTKSLTTSTKAAPTTTPPKTNGTITTAPPAQFTGAASQVAAGLGSVFALAVAALAAL